MGELAAALGVRPPTVTKMVTRMEAQGLVRRETSASDSRVAHVRLTETGSGMLDRIANSWRDADEAAFSGMKKKELRRLEKALKRICGNLAGTAADSGLPDDEEA
jgi:DNA-binding MarR family transcriptional regulator